MWTPLGLKQKQTKQTKSPLVETKLRLVKPEAGKLEIPQEMRLEP